MEQIVIAYKKIKEVARLLVAANERALAAEVEALATKHGKSPLTLHTLRHVCQSVMTAKQLDVSDESAELRS